MIKRSTLALAIAIAAPLALATAEQAPAAPALSSSSALKASSASVVTDVQYVYDFGPYGYRPVYKPEVLATTNNARRNGAFPTASQAFA